MLQIWAVPSWLVTRAHRKIQKSRNNICCRYVAETTVQKCDIKADVIERYYRTGYKKYEEYKIET